MDTKFYDYRLERERDARWYRLTIYGEDGTTDYSMEAIGSILINGSGHIASINGNGCKRRDFSNLRIKLYRNNVFRGRQPAEVLVALEEMVCSGKT